MPRLRPRPTDANHVGQKLMLSLKFLCENEPVEANRVAILDAISDLPLFFQVIGTGTIFYYLIAKGGTVLSDEIQTVPLAR